MSKYKINRWLTKPRVAGLMTFLLLALAGLCAIWLLTDNKSIQVIISISVLVFIISLTGGLIAANAFKTPARIQQLVVERTAELEKDIAERKKAANELLESREHLRLLSNYIENIREEERRNIARLIHEELGQYLTVLKMDVSRIGKRVTAMEDTLAADINELLDSINKMVESVRHISSELRPGMLDDIGLAATLDWYCHEFMKRTGIKTSFISDLADDKFPQNLNVGIFRIFQDTLTNVAKHSEAKKTNVSLLRKDNQLVLLIEDNGKGFDTTRVNYKNKTLGILAMKERVMVLGGMYNINSTPGKGTIIEVSVPLNQTIV